MEGWHGLDHPSLQLDMPYIVAMVHTIIWQIIVLSFIFQAQLQHEKEIWPAFNDQIC